MSSHFNAVIDADLAFLFYLYFIIIILQPYSQEKKKKKSLSCNEQVSFHIYCSVAAKLTHKHRWLTQFMRGLKLKSYCQAALSGINLAMAAIQINMVTNFNYDGPRLNNPMDKISPPVQTSVRFM